MQPSGAGVGARTRHCNKHPDDCDEQADAELTGPQRPPHPEPSHTAGTAATYEAPSYKGSPLPAPELPGSLKLPVTSIPWPETPRPFGSCPTCMRQLPPQRSLRQQAGNCSQESLCGIALLTPEPSTLLSRPSLGWEMATNGTECHPGTHGKGCLSPPTQVRGAHLVFSEWSQTVATRLYSLGGLFF